MVLETRCQFSLLSDKKSDKGKTAIITKYGLFQFTQMSFILCKPPTTYARVMNLALHGLTWSIVLAFLDDILVMGHSVDDHRTNLQIVLVFDRFRQCGLKLKATKCLLFQREVEFLGRKVNKPYWL